MSLRQRVKRGIGELREMRYFGSIQFISSNPKISWIVEMEQTPIGVQIEFLEFETLSNDESKLNLHEVFRSVTLRGLSHDYRTQPIAKHYKQFKIRLYDKDK